MRLPSLNAIRIFETAARHRNFTDAASELFLTQGSVSKQIKLLESELNVTLFEQDGRSMKLTDHGKYYSVAVREALSILRNCSEKIRGSHGQNELSVEVSPLFFARWIKPRLSQIYNNLPGINFVLGPSQRVGNETAALTTDVAIKAGRGEWLYPVVNRLSQDSISVFASPTLLARKNAFLDVSEIADHTLVKSEKYWDEWPRWFDQQGVTYVGKHSDILFSDEFVMIEAAIQGQGLILTKKALIEDELRSGQLVQVNQEAMVSEIQYYLVSNHQQTDNILYDSFRNWLMESFNFNIL